MLKTTVWNELSINQKKSILQRSQAIKDEELNRQVQLIIASIREAGDAAVKQYTQQFDNVAISDLQVSEDELNDAYKFVEKPVLDALQRIRRQLTAFHIKQLPSNYAVETSPGIVCESQSRPIPKVGLYIPAGTAPLVSTVLMLGVPAEIAGSPVRILCSPPNALGKIDPAILVAAQLCGIKKIYKAGGAQAIAAMAYGTETIPKVDKIFGPGNRWVTQAKCQVALDSQGAIYDLPAGPSEAMVIADKDANPCFVAADLLAQAEHDQDSQVFLVSTDLNLIEQVKIEINLQLQSLSRKQIVSAALQNSALILVDSVESAIEIANEYAPEHLLIQIKQPRRIIPAIQAAGSVFLGPWTPETLGDYASGTNHVLPTSGFAKSLSGVTVGAFMKSISFQEANKAGLTEIADTIRTITTFEGLDAHQQAIDIRLRALENENGY